MRGNHRKGAAQCSLTGVSELSKLEISQPPASLAVRGLTDLNKQLLFASIRFEGVLIEVNVFLSALVPASFHCKC